MSNSYQIVSPELTVKAMRDSGYKSTAYALAELIDNSIDAQAPLVELFVCEEPVLVNTQTRPRVETIAVLDNGKGMDADTLRRALKYGDGRRDDGPRIGRFGMGLPNSSMSQCCKVEVWSWTTGPENALRTYLELDQISKGLMTEVPDPERDSVPTMWQELSLGLGKTGTLVVWSDLDRVQWFGAAATLHNTEQLIGRVYRHYLSNDTVAIRLVPVREGKVIDEDRYAKPNDPLYLMAPSCTPTPFSSRPMFEPISLGEEDTIGEGKFAIDHNGATHEVTIRASIASPQARRADAPEANWPATCNPAADPGRHPWGKHADRNLGVSLVRQGRELDLDRSWANSYDPRERWWGLEVEFPRELDGVFGVTNTKQNAMIFSALADFNWENERLGDETYPAFLDRLKEADDPRLPLIGLAQRLKSLLSGMRVRIQHEREGARGGNKRHQSTAEAKATDAVNRRREEEQFGKTDELDDVTTSEESRKQQITSLVEVHHLDQDVAESLVDEGRRRQLRARWVSSPQDSPAFFSIDFMPGMLQVIFNSRHLVHDELMALLEDVPDEATLADLRRRLNNAADTFRLLVFSWARYEDELPEKQRQRAQEARQDWGRYAREFLQGEDA